MGVPVSDLDGASAVVDLSHTLADQVGDRRAALGQVLRQVHSERGHLARQPLVAALDGQRFHALLVTGQTALRGIVWSDRTARNTRVRPHCEEYSGQTALGGIVGSNRTAKNTLVRPHCKEYSGQTALRGILWSDRTARNTLVRPHCEGILN